MKNKAIPSISMNIDMNCEVDKMPTVPRWSFLNISITERPILYMMRYNAPHLPSGRSFFAYKNSRPAIIKHPALENSWVGYNGTPFGA